ncbi:MAG: hypothetical protein DI551_05775 [Micavibrio aeruginosavorus]|uniref:DUF2125 domain-containing protein n=1 Tax=Micavibrio aeruginosavorus TaxID=349221 RepID=A0A2W5PN70_9BACT|nr:MAG: hypothetical protein DI551_05775 [Micavibrio aeruginosavorus]
MSKRLKISLLAGALVLIGLYLALWLYSAQWLRREIDTLYANAQEEGVEFLGPKPTLGNFPFKPRMIYSGGIKTGNLEVLFPQVTLTGYPLPFMTLEIDFPLGIMLGGFVDPKVWTVDQLNARVGIPYRLPRSFTQEDLADWRDHGGSIDVRSYTIRKRDLNSKGQGYLALDEALQPIFSFESEVTGYDAFISAQIEEGIIERLPGAIAMTILNGLSTTDEKTGQKKVILTASVKNRLLSVGPLQALELPPIVWDTRNSPVPRPQ